MKWHFQLFSQTGKTNVFFFLFPSLTNSSKEFSLIRENVDRAQKSNSSSSDGSSSSNTNNNTDANANGGGKSETDPELNPMLQRSVLAPLLISLGLMFFQQWSGVNAVIFYTVSIFDAADSAIEKNLATIIVGITQFLATFGNLLTPRAFFLFSSTTLPLSLIHI